jgi:hypothetical protein
VSVPRQFGEKQTHAAAISDPGKYQPCTYKCGEAVERNVPGRNLVILNMRATVHERKIAPS